MTDDFDPDRINKAIRKVNRLQRRYPIDRGNEIEHPGGLMERADGSFYQRGPEIDYEENDE